MPDLRVSQRTVVAERLQGAWTDTQLLADLLVVHPTAEPFPFPLAEDFIYPVGQAVAFISYTDFSVNNPFCLQSKSVVRMEQWICNEVAACGSKWSGVA